MNIAEELFVTSFSTILFIVVAFFILHKVIEKTGKKL
jgi:hypothetical protein